MAESSTQSERVPRAHLGCALFCFHFMLLFVGINLALAVAFRMSDGSHHAAAAGPAAPPEFRDDPRGRPANKPGRDPDSLQYVDLGAFDGVGAAEVETVLDEYGQFARQGYSFEPWVQFGPRPYAGTLVNVDEPEPGLAHRRSVPSPELRPASAQGEVKVFVFGGSTTFGVYVADGWTFCSYLWDLLQQQAPGRAVELVNFGRPYYYSSQELALLQRLVKTGHKPDVAIFVDGLNDCFMPFWQQQERDVPMFTSNMREWIYLAQFGKDWLTQYRWIPLVRLAYVLRERLAPKPGAPAPAASVDRLGENVVATYRDNVRLARAVCREYGIPCYFFWQPVPFYKYDMALHRRSFYLPQPLQEVFTYVYDRLPGAVPDTVFLGGVLEHFGHRKAFADNFHYSPAFNRFLAGQMARYIHLEH